MFNKVWEVLLVDDDPDVLAVSKLAMRSFTVWGIPLRVHTAASKAEAITLFETWQDLQPPLAVAIIDVVMETDLAGLELCQYIREVKRNRSAQIYVRTGQPGVAPERTVMDRYDINGYFSKAEATEDKLYSLVQAGVRQYYWTVTAVGNISMMRFVAMGNGSRAAVAGIAQQSLSLAFQNPSGDQADTFGAVRIAFLMGDEVVAKVGLSDEEARALSRRLDDEPGVPLTLTGERYVEGTGLSLSPAGDRVIVEDDRLLIRVGGVPDQGIGPVSVVADTTFRQPDSAVQHIYNIAGEFGALWYRSA